MTTSLRVLFADDEEMARTRMRRLLSALPELTIVGEARSGQEVLALLDDVDVDLAVLDVRMGLVSGLDAAARAADLGVEVIVTTAHRDHAVDAFDRGVVDYLLKPIDAARLAVAIERVRSRRAPLDDAASALVRPELGSAPSIAESTRLALEVRGEIHLIAAADVTHAVFTDTLVEVHSVGRGPQLTELSLTDIERRLPHLFRAHRRALVSIAHIHRLRPLGTGGYVAILADGAEVPVSRQAARELRRRLGL